MLRQRRPSEDDKDEVKAEDWDVLEGDNETADTA